MDNFVEYRDENGELLMHGNTNTYQEVENLLGNMLVIASKIRIVPYSKHPRTVCLRVELKGCRYSGNFYNLLVNELGRLNSSLPEKALQVDDWDEKTFLGAAVGILITVVLAATAAAVLVVVRNRSQRKSLSELSQYTSTITDTNSTREKEFQSTMGSQGRFTSLEHQDMAMARAHQWEDSYTERTSNYTAPSDLRFGLQSSDHQPYVHSDEDDLSLSMFSTQKEQQEDQLSERTNKDLEEDGKVSTRCSTPYSASNYAANLTEDSLESKKMVLGKLSFSAPLRCAVVKTTKKSRPTLGVVVENVS